MMMPPVKAVNSISRCTSCIHAAHVCAHLLSTRQRLMTQAAPAPGHRHLNPNCAHSTQAIVSDVPSCGGVAYAQQHGIATLTYPASKKGLFPGLSKDELVQQMTDMGVEYVLLAGYLKVSNSCCRLTMTAYLHHAAS